MWTSSIEFAAKGASFLPRIHGPSCNRPGDTSGEITRPHQLIQEAQVPARFGNGEHVCSAAAAILPVKQLMGHD